MIKLKLTRSELTALCLLTNPVSHETKAINLINNSDYSPLDHLFNIIQIGEKLSKMLLYTQKDKYKVSLSYSEAASLFTHTYRINHLVTVSYEQNVVTMLRTELHQQITNYKRRFNANGNEQTAIAAGNSWTGKKALVHT